MAGRLFSKEEFEAELERRGCQKIEDNKAYGSLWVWSGNVHFTVPIPEEMEDGRAYYPDWMLDHLIASMGLPPAPLDN